ncbi:hypothetical protein E2C01_033766 [Portunus trituberculatus]|uniref:Uncharacterized protein n=1 Tax=Portunus trituberculatus TaxID=210409 RepID=A0A5B7EYR8_PORTR|nr:hypothetical protein [Portunus trituberculatus]
MRIEKVGGNREEATVSCLRQLCFGSRNHSHRCLFYNWDNQDLYAFPPLPLIKKVLNKLWEPRNTRLILGALYWPQKEWFPDLVGVLVEPP